MKTKILALGIVASLFAISCNKDDDKNNTPAIPLTAAEVRANAEMDNISDDVSYMAESESDETPSTGRTSGGSPTFLSGCATITTTISGNIWTRTLDFGATNCNLFNGNAVRGKIIITFTNDFLATTRTINYTFDNFYHNDRKVEGNRTVVRTIVNGHPKSTISLDMTVTTENGVYHRTGQRVREFTAGYNTWLNPYDNEFIITGAWTTTFPSGTTQTAAITSGLIVKWNCLHIVQGSVTFSRNNTSATAVLDYGDGTCDDEATVTINGVVHPIDLGF